MSPSRRNALLGIAATALAASYLLGFAATVVRASGPVLVPGYALLMIGRLALSAGFVVIGVAFRKGGRDPASWLRRGARVLAGAYIVILAANALPPFSRFGAAVDSAGYMSGRITLLASYLAWAGGAIIASDAFAGSLRSGPLEAPCRQLVVRDRRLGQAGIAFAAGSGLQVFSTLMSRWGFWAAVRPVPFDMVAGLLAEVLLLVAGIVAGIVFLMAARSFERREEEAFARRERALGVAALWLFLAAALRVASTLSVVHLLAGTGRGEAAYFALTWLSGLALVTAPLVAALGFELSRRAGGSP